ncbi:MAG: regulatory protein RecX [Legionellaceae bacterium]|nr:regulatory protein RecX [Legionellaceae bacterium]
MREAYEVAVGLLARREHSVRQLNQKLAKRGFDEQEITSALESCQRLNLQSDTRFAEATCRSRINRGYGPLMIKQLLQHEGVAPDVIEHVFDEINQEIDWFAEASAVWSKKFGSSQVLQVLNDRLDTQTKARQKQWQFLRYRGFSDATVRAVFQTLEAESNY